MRKLTLWILSLFLFFTVSSEVGAGKTATTSLSLKELVQRSEVVVVAQLTRRNHAMIEAGVPAGKDQKRKKVSVPIYRFGVSETLKGTLPGKALEAFDADEYLEAQIKKTPLLGEVLSGAVLTFPEGTAPSRAVVGRKYVVFLMPASDPRFRERWFFTAMKSLLPAKKKAEVLDAMKPGG